MDKEITFDIEEFLNEDCKEENEIGIKMTFTILRKAFEKGMQYSALYCYEKGMKDALGKLKTEINKNIEQEDSARYVFINEEKDYRKANHCTGRLQAYEKVLDMIGNLLKENTDGNTNRNDD